MIFKTCPKCKVTWKTRDDFLKDPALELIGYQANFENLKLGLFLFNHDCKGTLSVNAEKFLDLYDGNVFSQRVTGTNDCPEHCLITENLSPCPAICECAYIREVLQIIKNKKL